MSLAAAACNILIIGFDEFNKFSCAAINGDGLNCACAGDIPPTSDGNAGGPARGVRTPAGSCSIGVGPVVDCPAPVGANADCRISALSRETGGRNAVFGFALRVESIAEVSSAKSATD